ncbi:MAG: hypothetical protein KJS91_09055 [Planctomycetes bacterium]|nr:hypothetical protein [Planctomycetota bacterium]
MTRLATTLLILAATAGCGEFEKLELHPLSGSVARGGKPVRDGGIIFLPVDPSGRALTVNASVRDGTFEAVTDRTSATGRTLIERGAPVGRYKPVYHPQSDGSKAGLEVELETIEVAPGGVKVRLELPEAMPTGTGQRRDDHSAGKQPD